MLKAILADGEFTPRAITRNTVSEVSQKLAGRGVEVVQADLDDVQSLRKAFTGCEGVFSVSLSITVPAIVLSDSDDRYLF